MSESATPEAGPLSVDQAIAALAPEPVEQPTEEAAPVEAAADPEPEIEAEASPAEEPAAEVETLADEEDETTEQEPAVEPLAAPAYWSQEAKAKFSALDPELQAVVLAQEGPREEAAAKAKAEAADVRKVADAELGKVAQLAEGLAAKLPEWIKAFETNWGTKTPDWAAHAEAVGVEQMTLDKIAFERDAASLIEASRETQRAQSLAQEQYFKAEHARLAEIAPELAHPETGPAKRTAVTQYLVKTGIAPDAIQTISAAEMNIAHKAMLWDQAQAALKATPTPKPVIAPVARSPVRPAAAAQSSSRSALQSAQSAFNLNPSRENAEALMLAKG